MDPNPERKRQKTIESHETHPNLPEEVWALIFSKIRNTICLVVVVQGVCRLFRKICKRPSMFYVLDMKPLERDSLKFKFDEVSRCAVDRSSGGVTHLNLDFPCHYLTLNHIITSSKNLKHLRLGPLAGVSERELIEAAKLLPKLEELEIHCLRCGSFIEHVGRSCCALKSFSMDNVKPLLLFDEEALAVGGSMRNLLHLQLTGSHMTNIGLKAILDGCPLLESLDIRGCFKIDLSGDLGERCESIKNLRRPYDSAAGYPHEDSIAFDSLFTQEDSGYGFDQGLLRSTYDF